MATDALGGSPHPSAGLIGRRVELGWLRGRFEQAMRGVAQLILVDGDPGIGKTRLATELLDDARRAGARVVRGRCYEQLRFAYLPLRESLFVELAAWAAGQPALGVDASVLATLVDGRDGDGAPDPADVGARARQLLALTRLTIEFVRARPTVLFVDDLHWADDATMDLLRHLLFRFEDEAVPLLVVATARRDPTAPAAAAVERLRVESRAAGLTVHPLSAIEATQLARELGGRVPIERARSLAGASGGNPLLIEALTRQPGTDRSRPATLEAAHPMTTAIAADLDRLSAPARSLVRVAAVLLPSCPEWLLLRTVELEPAAASTALAEALDARILTHDDPGLDFGHPLYAHLAYGQTPADQRRLIHARAAALLLEDAEPDVRTVARHLLGAGSLADPGVVATHSRRAGDLALAAAAWADAATFYEAAIAATGAADAATVAELHRLAGLSRRGNLELDRAVEHFEAAIEALGDDADVRTLTDLHTWRVRCGIGSHGLLGVVDGAAMLERLLTEVEDADPSLAAEALVEVSQAHWIRGDMEESERAARHAMRLAAGVGDTAAAARAAMSLSVPQWARYDLEPSLATLRAGSVDPASTPLAADLAGGARFRIPLVLAWLGRLDEAAATARDCCDLAEEVDYPLEEGLPLAALALVALTRGDFDAAEEFAHKALLVQRLSGYHWAAGLYLPVRAMACAARGAFDGADDALTIWRETAGPAERLTIDLLQRYLDGTRRSIPLRGEQLLGLPRAPAVGADTWTALTLDIARREGLAVDADAAYRLLTEHEARGGVVVSGTGMLVTRLRGVAADLAGADATAVEVLARAAAQAEDLDARPERARALADLAVVHLRRSERDEAAVLLDEAVPELEALGMHPEARRAAAVDGSPYRRSHLPSPAPDADPEAAVPTPAVILFTDVVDSTRLTEELGNEGYWERARRMEALVASSVAAHHGTVVSGINLGDGLIGLFHDVAPALRAALICARDAAPLTDLHLHLAVHSGNILVDGARISGGPVNYAARVCALAGQDELLVSQSVRDAADPIADVAFVDRGGFTLKGITGEQRLYAAVATDSTSIAHAAN